MATLPFRPNVSAADPLRDLHRAATVRAVAAVRGGRNVDEVARELYGPELGGRIAATITKAAVAPADTSTAAWAGALAGTGVGPFLRSLRPRSAAAQLFDLASRFDLGRNASLSLPKLSTAFPNAAWVAEGAPAPVLQGAFASTTLTPRKLMALSALTGELAAYSAEVAERVVAELMTDSAARALDAKMFSADAATATAPAGILNGIAATAGTAGGGQTALATDLKALVGAVATAGGGGNLVIVASPAQAVSLQVLGGQLTVPVISAPSLAAATVIVMDAGAFASAFGAEPRIDIAEGAVVHLEDTSPLAIGTAGAPNTVAAPTRSAFQADIKVLRVILRAGWALRTPALAWTGTATW